MMALIVVLLGVAEEPAARVDWAAGVVRVPAPTLVRATGECQTLAPAGEVLATQLLECLWCVQIDSEVQVKHVFESPDQFCNLFVDAPGRSTDGHYEVSLWGEEGVLERIRQWRRESHSAGNREGEERAPLGSKKESASQGGDARPPAPAASEDERSAADSTLERDSDESLAKAAGRVVGSHETVGSRTVPVSGRGPGGES